MGDSIVVTRKAEYSCVTRLRARETEVVTRDVSVSVAKDEDPAAKLAAAAKDLEKTISGCYNPQFNGFVPTAEELAKKAEEACKAAQARAKTSGDLLQEALIEACKGRRSSNCP